MHYKKTVGDQVLNRIFTTDAGIVGVDFGVQLHSGNIDGYLADVARQGEIYRRNHVDEVQLVKETVVTAMGETIPH